MSWGGQVPCHPVEVAGLVYVEVPKAACTSIKYALASFKGRTEGIEEIHGWFGYTHARDSVQLHEWLVGRWVDFFTFTVVRHPVTRFESFYYEKLTQAQRDVYGSIDRYILRNFERDSEWRWNPHTVPQTAFLGTDLSAFDYVGHVEGMDEVSQVLSKQTGTRIRVGHENRSTQVREPMSPIAEEALRDIYRHDFAVLGYAE